MIEQWEVEESVRSVVCPVCAFTFDAQQWTFDAGNPCPACNEIRLELQLAEATIRGVRAMHECSTYFNAWAYFKLRAETAEGKLDAVRAEVEPLLEPGYAPSGEDGRALIKALARILKEE